MERKEVMNVVYSSDDNYVQHAVTSIVSLAQNNKNFKTINIYLIENNIMYRKTKSSRKFDRKIRAIIFRMD